MLGQYYFGIHLGQMNNFNQIIGTKGASIIFTSHNNFQSQASQQ